MDKVLKGKACTVKINISPLQEIASLFEPGGNLQKFIDLEIARLSDPYVPSDTTAMRKSVYARSQFGSGEIIYEIYGDANGKNSWNDHTSRFQDAPRRGPEWAVRMLNEGGKEKLEEAARRFIDRGL